MAFDAEGFDRAVALPPELKVAHIREAIEHVEDRATVRMKPGKLIAVWRVDIPFLREEDWKYEGSKAAEGRGGRTHTFGVKNPAKRFRDSIVYQSPRVIISQGGPVLAS